jgi:hypothetical protein
MNGMIRDTTVYLTDNGAVLCGRHLGVTAKTTGRDISGQRILPFTPDIVAMMDGRVVCETCRHANDWRD